MESKIESTTEIQDKYKFRILGKTIIGLTIEKDISDYFTYILLDSEGKIASN